MIAPTLACMDYMHIERDVLEMDRAKVDFFHVDIMDGHFVPNLCLNFDIVKKIRAVSRVPMNVHLMVSNPMDYVGRLAENGISYACAHLNACADPQAFLDGLHSCGVKAGFAVAPDDDFEALVPYLSKVDYILVLFVNPGFSGQILRPEVFERLQKLSDLRRKNGYCYLIEADGGIGWDNAAQVLACGADILVAGVFAVFGQSMGLYEACLQFGRISSNETAPAAVEMPSRYDRLLGALIGAAAGDAMGSATETLTQEMIPEIYGGPVHDFVKPVSGVPAEGQEAGEVSCNFSLIMSFAGAILASGGAMTEEITEAAIKQWYTAGVHTTNIGQTMEKCVCRLLGLPLRPMGVMINPDLSPALLVDNHASTNGAAARMLPIGLLHPGDRVSAIQGAIKSSRPSHRNSAALAGACAVAAAVSEAMRPGTTLEDIVEAGVEGARLGHKAAVSDGQLVAVPSVDRRIRLAVELAIKARSLDEAMRSIANIVGCGNAAYESIPAVFGLLVAAKGNPADCIYAAVNIGNDTDTIACMIGGIIGAHNGVSAFPASYIETLEKANGYDLRAIARQMDECISAQEVPHDAL